MAEAIFTHRQYGPYEQMATIKVQDEGNQLPIDLTMLTGDPSSVTSNSMTITMAEVYHKQLGEAIEAAKKAGLKDGGYT